MSQIYIHRQLFPKSWAFQQKVILNFESLRHLGIKNEPCPSGWQGGSLNFTYSINEMRFLPHLVRQIMIFSPRTSPSPNIEKVLLLSQSSQLHYTAPWSSQNITPANSNFSTSPLSFSSQKIIQTFDAVLNTYHVSNLAISNSFSSHLLKTGEKALSKSLIARETIVSHHYYWYHPASWFSQPEMSRKVKVTPLWLKKATLLKIVKDVWCL